MYNPIERRDLERTVVINERPKSDERFKRQEEFRSSRVPRNQETYEGLKAELHRDASLQVLRQPIVRNSRPNADTATQSEAQQPAVAAPVESSVDAFLEAALQGSISGRGPRNPNLPFDADTSADKSDSVHDAWNKVPSASAQPHAQQQQLPAAVVRGGGANLLVNDEMARRIQLKHQNECNVQRKLQQQRRLLEASQRTESTIVEAAELSQQRMRYQLQPNQQRWQIQEPTQIQQQQQQQHRQQRHQQQDELNVSPHPVDQMSGMTAAVGAQQKRSATCELLSEVPQNATDPLSTQAATKTWNRQSQGIAATPRLDKSGGSRENENLTAIRADMKKMIDESNGRVSLRQLRDEFCGDERWIQRNGEAYKEISIKSAIYKFVRLLGDMPNYRYRDGSILHHRPAEPKPVPAGDDAAATLITAAIRFILHTMPRELKHAVTEHPSCCNAPDCLLCVARKLVNAVEEGTMCESEAEILLNGVGNPMKKMIKTPYTAVKHMLVALGLPQRNIKATHRCERCGWRAASQRDSGVIRLAESGGTIHRFVHIGDSKERLKCPNCNDRESECKFEMQLASVICIDLSNKPVVKLPDGIDHYGRRFQLCGAVHKQGADVVAWARGGSDEKVNFYSSLSTTKEQHWGTTSEPLVTSDGEHDATSVVFALYRASGDSPQKTVDGGVSHFEATTALDAVTFKRAHPRLEVELYLQQLSEQKDLKAVEADSSMFYRVDKLDAVTMTYVFDKNPGLLSRLGRSPSRFHFDLLCRHPSLGKQLWAEVSPSEDVTEYLQHLASALIGCAGNLRPDDVLDVIVSLPRSFTTQRFHYLCVSLGKKYYVTLLEAVFCEFATWMRSSPGTREACAQMTNLCRFCTALFKKTSSEGGRFARQTVLDRRLPQQLMPKDAAAVGAPSLYGLAVALFDEAHGRGCLVAENSRYVKLRSEKAAKELAAARRAQGVVFKMLRKTPVAVSQERASLVAGKQQSDFQVASKERDHVAAEVSSRKLFDVHAEFIAAMEETPEVKAVCAKNIPLEGRDSSQAGISGLQLS